MNNPDNAPLTFTYHWYVKLVAVIGMLVFGSCSVLSIFEIWGKADWLASITFPSLTLLSIVFLLWTGKRYTVREDGVLTRSWYGQEDLQYWADMEGIETTGLGNGIRIKNQFGKSVLAIDPWIARYELFAEALRQYKPELFDRRVNTLRRNPIIYIIGIFFSLIFIASSINAFLDEQILAGIGLLLFGILILILVLRIPLAVHLLESRLKIEYLRGERIISAGEIRNIYPKVVRDLQGGGGATAIIELCNGHTVELAGYKEGVPVAINTLRNWLDDYRRKKDEMDENGPGTFL
jgi:hypothetical protein